jgi:hypothetical protein
MLPLLMVILPENVFGVSAASSRMYIGVGGSVPASVMVKLPPEPLQVLLSGLTSKPDGAVTVKLPPGKTESDMLKPVDDDAVPVIVLNAAGVPLVESAGPITKVALALLALYTTPSPSLTAGQMALMV